MLAGFGSPAHRYKPPSGQKRPGETVRLELVREGKRESVDVRLSDKPQ
jgi:S1-C subfamily serine protease